MSRKDQKRLAKALAKVGMKAKATSKGFKVVLKSGSVVRFCDPDAALGFIKRQCKDITI